MDIQITRLRRIRILATILTLLSLLIVLVSAYIRHKGAGLGCTPWPDCFGQSLLGGQSLQDNAARILHRSVASLALLLGFVLAWQCRRPQPVAPAPYAAALLGLMIVLTFVGVWSADPRRVWAGFINILGGAGLVLLSWRTALAAMPQPPVSTPRRHAALMHGGLGLLVLTIALGALIGARYATIACPSLPGCGDASWPADWSVLNPFTTLVAVSAPGDQGGAALHLLHRISALSTLLLLGIGGLQALAAPAARASAGLLLLLLLTQFTLGVLIVLSGFGPGLAIAHGVCAGALLATGMHVLVRIKSGPG